MAGSLEPAFLFFRTQKGNCCSIDYSPILQQPLTNALLQKYKLTIFIIYCAVIIFYNSLKTIQIAPYTYSFIFYTISHIFVLKADVSISSNTATAKTFRALLNATYPKR